MKISKKQADFLLNANAKINISHGSVRSGKTFITNIKWLEYIKNGPPGKLLMSGRTKETLKENVLDDLFAMVGKGNYHYKPNTGELVIFGRKIKCIGADKIDAEAKIRGQTYAGWYGDEITIQHPKFVKQAITRQSVPGARIFWTTNPDHPKHYIKTDFIDNKEMVAKGQVKSWHFTLLDNHTLTDDYIDLLKASFSGVFYKRNIDGLWVIAEGVVYGDDFKPDIHVVSQQTIEQMIQQNQFREYIGGADFGFTHPMVGLIYGVTGDPLYPTYYQIGEFYKTGEKTEALRDWFLKWEERLNAQLKVIFCDSAEPDRIITLQEKGLRATTSDKQISPGINTVQTLFKNNRLFISDTCQNTQTELETYRYPNEDDTDAQQRKDIPIDDDNHAMDAKRYCLHNYEKHLISKRKKAEKRLERTRRKSSIV